MFVGVEQAASKVIRHKLLISDLYDKQQTSVIPPEAAAWCPFLVVLASVLQAFLAQPEVLLQAHDDIRAGVD